MASYDFKCAGECDLIFEARGSMKDYDTWKHTVKCPNCEGATTRYIGEPPCAVLPANLTVGGARKTLIGTRAQHTKTKLTQPINIWDEKPDGGYTVTRIGDDD